MFKHNKQYCKVSTLTTNLGVLYNYFNGLTKLFLDLYKLINPLIIWKIIWKIGFRSFNSITVCSGSD